MTCLHGPWFLLPFIFSGRVYCIKLCAVKLHTVNYRRFVVENLFLVLNWQPRLLIIKPAFQIIKIKRSKSFPKLIKHACVKANNYYCIVQSKKCWKASRNSEVFNKLANSLLKLAFSFGLACSVLVYSLHNNTISLYSNVTTYWKKTLFISQQSLDLSLWEEWYPPHSIIIHMLETKKWSKMVYMNSDPAAAHVSLYYFLV